MARGRHRLTVKEVEAATSRRLADGDGLWLNVSKAGKKTWVFRWTKDKKVREIGLGPYGTSTKGTVSLSAARAKAEDCRQQISEGRHPKEATADKDIPSFDEAATKFLNSKVSKNWQNEKHRNQWQSTLSRKYCGKISDKSVADIGVEDVLKVLNPIWHKTPETAQRLRGRIEHVLAFAKVKGWRDGENPATWKSNLEHQLSKPDKLSRGHHAALPYEDAAAFMLRLRERSAMSARALEFAILTAARSGEVLGATWDEIDMGKAIWTVPKHRMKARVEHRVPLTDPAMKILRPLFEAKLSDYVFPGQRPGRPLSNMSMQMLMRKMKVDATPHGFRSTFRDFLGDETSVAREVAEGCLAHAIGSKSERSYRRADALQKRREALTIWADYIDSATPEENIVQLREISDGG